MGTDSPRPKPLRRLLEWLDLGISPSEVSRTEMRQIRVVALATATLVGIGVPSIPHYWALGIPPVSLALSIAMLAALANLELLRRTRRPLVCGHIGIAILTGILVFSNAHSGGFTNPHFSWLYTVPFAAALVLDSRGAWAWVGIVLAITVGLWSAEQLGLGVPNAVPPELRAWHDLFNRVTALAGFGLISWSFVSGQRRAERDLERANVEIQREASYVQLLEHAAAAANEANDLDAAMHDGLRRTCQTMGWVAGLVYVVDEDGNLAASEYFHAESGQPLDHYREMMDGVVIRPGELLAGRALVSRRPVAAYTLTDTSERTRRAQDQGIQAGFAIPVLVHGEVAAVLECGAPEPQTPNPRLLEVLHHMGVQLGKVGERAALQERLRQSQRLEAVGRLAAGIAHEINNPMAYVRSNLNHLRAEWGALRTDFEKHDALQAAATRIEDCEDLLVESLEGVERTVSIVSDMREMSHSAGTTRGRADVAEVADQAARIASARAPEGVDIEVAPPVAPVEMTCAPSQLRQVFVNLIANAIDAVGERGQVRVSTHSEASRVVVRVEDDGPGMTDEVRERIFDPFFTTKPVGQGTGLGLAISYEIVSAHAGQIRVSSQPGGGTSVEVHLPLDVTARAQPADAGDARD